ncbi:MAG: PIN domain-containing protein [Chloroflexota bacterium]
MTRILVDTSALVAFLDADDPRHDRVVAAFADLANDDLFTHGYVVAESLAVVRRRLGLEATTTLIDDLLPTMELLAIDPDLHERAQERYRQALPSATSFVDQVSFALMEREAIATALVLDPDFAAPGRRLIPEP